MNTQQQEIDIVQHENKWQAPVLTELGKINNETQNGPQSHRTDGSFNFS